ncbi:NAD(P)/FAD-dependent oxidoreductase [Antarcticibacterium flavum]|uniref:NAD(P)/FAD-dependent oxidoreductase n=1 Tax=Antarcticibacterium flavum TaxID=2058175 RepID=A0A5B7X0F0_9FLAO|nr:MULTISPECIES: NAD(P)/FAD-dependent oxidoreductase [Antarcticibacterium]MCM4158817.1 pyridine nucleotide-disulfide oxidoreductase [Antarcticibacterium sp. W02-3]QCY68081.1 NAD(P)/FAD-dependent oxidoreductase [Antarcticibacterium flavum]
MKKEITDILVIGAGPSGIVAASYLHEQGVKVKIIEKSTFPRFSIGESLIPQCMDNLKEAGLLEAVMKAGFQKKYGARFIKGSEVGEFDFSLKHGKGWDWTWQVPRADFDMVLAQEAMQKGIEINFNSEFLDVNFYGKSSVSKIRTAEGEIREISAKLIIDASGYGRVLAGKLGLEAKPQVSAHSSMFTHIKETNRPKGKEGELITFEVLSEKVWFWYFPFSNGNSSLGFVGPNEWFAQFPEENELAMQGMMQQLEYYKGRFDQYEFLFPPGKVENISKNVSKLYGEGFVLTGNSAEFLDPVFSSGVAFATSSGLLAAKLAARELKGEIVDWQKEYVDYIKRGVNVFSSYVREWYTGNLQKIIFHPNPRPEIKEQICAVLAGYVWDESNPFVKKHERILRNVARLIEMEENPSSV